MSQPARPPQPVADWRARLRPVLDWPAQLRDLGVLRADLLAGLTVAIVAVPQGLAYAQLAGLPPHLGLYAAFIPTVIAALWGSCAQLSTGPVALTSLLVAASLTPVLPAGAPGYLGLAVVLALLSGLLQGAAGLLRAGRIVERMPEAVVLGFVNAAALMIAASQLPALFGVAGPREPNLLRTAIALRDGLSGLHVSTTLFGVSSLAAMWWLRRVNPRWPGALLALVAGIAVSRLIDFEGRGGRTIGDLPAGLPSFTLPPGDLGLYVVLLPAALTIALVSFVEVLSSSKAISAKTGREWDIDRELVGQGLAKIAAAFSGAFPVSGSFSRSALNYTSRAKTPLASILCGLLVGVALLFATGVLYHLPRAVLSAVIVLAVISLFTPGQMLALWRHAPRDGLVATITFAATLVTAPRIHYGLLGGLAVAALMGGLRRLRSDR